MTGLIVALLIAAADGSQHLVPASEFRVSFQAIEQNCPPLHYHAKQNFEVTALDGTVIPDPDRFFCGYGLVGQVPVTTVATGVPNDADFDGIPELFDPDPNDPDANDDGIPDSDEDPDGDRLTTSFELGVSMTNPNEADSDGNGKSDALDYGLAQHERRYTHVWSIAGALVGSGLDAADMREVVGRTNDILLQANVRYVTTQFVTNVSDGNGDGTIAPEERLPLETMFNQWVTMNWSTGLYVGFGGTDYAPDFGNPAGYVRTPTPSLFVKAGFSFDGMAAAAAHETLHNFFAKHPKVGLSDDVPNNVMNRLNLVIPYVEANGIDDLFVPERQLARIGKKQVSNLFGRVTYVDDLAVTRRPYQLGTVSDAFDDGGGSYLDLDLAVAESEEGLDRVKIAWDYFGETPDAPVALKTALLFDLDDDATTGSTVDGFPGIDGIYEAWRLREDSGEPLKTATVKTDAFGFEREPWSDAFQLQIQYQFANDEGVPAGEGFALSLSKAALGFGARRIPIYIVSCDEDQVPRDTASLTFDLDAYMKDPTVDILGSGSFGSGGGSGGSGGSGGGGYTGASASSEPAEAELLAVTNGDMDGPPYAPGEDVAFAIRGLTPETAFELLVNGAVVLAAESGSTGSFDGAFAVPADLPAGNHFVTAVDAAGEFGGSVLIVPEPGGLALLAVLLGGLAGLPGARRARGRRKNR